MSSKSRFLLWTALVSTLLLAACSSKPEQHDIEKSLAVAYECPAVEVREVKKLNGEAGPQGTYDVAFSYVVAFKGGEEGAKKTLLDWLALRREASAVGEALRGQVLQNLDANARQQVQASLLAYDKQNTDQIAKMFPCEGKELDAVLAPLFQQAWEAARTASGPVSLPIGVRISRTGRMGNSENGWYLKQLALGFEDFQTLETQPMAVTLPPSKVAGILAAATSGASSDRERTAAARLRVGTADSCLVVVVGGNDKCYELPADAVQARRVLDVCADADACTVTGVFDDKAERVMSVSKVEKASR